MKKYLKALYESFGHTRLYYDVIHRWQGACYLYALLLAAITTVMVIIGYVMVLQNFSTAEKDHILDQWPTITLSQGEISAPPTEPTTITSKSGRVLIVIDTTATQSELGKHDAPIAIGKDFLLSKNADGSVRTTDLKKYKNNNFTLDREKIDRFLSMFRFIPIFMMPFLIAGQWLMIIAMMVMAAILSYVVTAYMKEEFTFDTRMRIGAIALTPPLLINQLLHLIGNYSLGMWTIVVLWVLHMYVIVIAARKYQGKLDRAI